MPDSGAVQLTNLSRRLRDAGAEGKGLRRALMKAITDAAQPIAEKIGDPAHLKPYLPDRYADVLAADLGVKIVKSFSGDPKVSIRAQAREHRRKIKRLDQGLINHPIYARGPRRSWDWQTGQTGGMRAGFFSDVVRDAPPEVRERIMEAISEVARQITAG